MSEQKKVFVDFYEILQVSPNAEADTIRKVFRLLAKKFHPDNLETGNKEYFDVLCQAHKTLTEPELRAAYDARYQEGRKELWQLSEEANQTAAATLGAATGDVDMTSKAVDRAARARLLSLLYVQRRRDVEHPGMGQMEIERLLETPRELLDFHIWFLKEKGWISKLDTGKLAITVEGVDQVEAGFEQGLREDRMLPEHASPSSPQRRSLHPGQQAIPQAVNPGSQRR